MLRVLILLVSFVSVVAVGCVFFCHDLGWVWFLLTWSFSMCLRMFWSFAAQIHVSLFFKSLPIVSSVSSGLRKWLMSSSHLFFGHPNAKVGTAFFCFCLSILFLGEKRSSLQISISFFFASQSSKGYWLPSSFLQHLVVVTHQEMFTPRHGIFTSHRGHVIPHVSPRSALQKFQGVAMCDDLHVEIDTSLHHKRYRASCFI